MTARKKPDEDDGDGLAGALVPAGRGPKPPVLPKVGARFREVRRKMVRPVEDKMLRGPRDFEIAQDEVDGGSLGPGD